jgi:hypothetical protein
LKPVGMAAFVVARVPMQVVTGDDGDEDEGERVTGNAVEVQGEEREEEDGGRTSEKLPLYAQHVENAAEE